MILKQIELTGFRGSKGTITIPFGPGFTIITGRNGSGKSSVCDAIEFALVGHLTRFAASDVEGGERLDDYIWWRDGADPANRQVKAVFQLDNGQTGERTATPKGIRSSFDGSLFYKLGSHPPDPLARLVQTALVRDESIVKFSTDLPEADRFDFFYKAIGVTDLVRVEHRANSLVQRLKRRIESLETEYRTRREKVAQIIQEISEARIIASRVSTLDVAATQKKLAALTGSASDIPLSQLTLHAQHALAEQKQRVQALERLSIDFSQSESWRERLQILQSKCEEARKVSTLAENVLKNAAEARIIAGERLRTAQSASPLLGSLAQLKEHGSRIGLQAGRCPLCGSQIAAPEFNAHVNQIQAEIDRQSSTLSQLTQEEANRSADYTKRRDEFQTRSLEYSRALSDFETLKAAMHNLEEQATTLEVALSSEGIESALREARLRATDLDSGLLALEGSTAFDRISDLEKQRSLAQNDADAVTKQIDSLSIASQNAKTAADTTKRVSWEAVDDCLAELSPLLSELFLRLRPHVDYSEVKYRMRGDVKRFLSFAVGNGINPRFTFSSGQRRALGLAFLLAVHLSRPWCNLKTLVLDDPVQHIDDYRALHFAEVLSSIRQMGHQVVCTVEDPALADLLCRRLRSTTLGDGIRIELQYQPGTGSTVRALEPIGPLPDRVLVSA